MRSKDSLRNQVRLVIRTLSETLKVQAGHDVAKHVIKVLHELHVLPGSIIASFQNLPDEIPTDFLNQSLTTLGYEVVFPRHFPDGTMEFVRPSTEQVVSPDIFAVVIVPGMAFDKHGNRLGRGKGYYDRLLAQVRQQSTPLLTIGIGFEEQLLPHIPVESHDQVLDYIVTPNWTTKSH